MTHTCPRCSFAFDDAIEVAAAPLAAEATVEALAPAPEEQENTGKPTLIGNET